ncbi:hypothetical protein [Micromonospora globbae]|uniref:hypothetical protein n=1 Tax=Micromonospora globbae TaxID=1894969 RepID=UPI0013153036|nr:hypothetical protein [Micromonospora globbae]
MTSETEWRPSTNGELDAWGRGYLTGWERGYADALEALGIDTTPQPAETTAPAVKED